MKASVSGTRLKGGVPVHAVSAASGEECESPGAYRAAAEHPPRPDRRHYRSTPTASNSKLRAGVGAGRTLSPRLRLGSEPR
jgi:hypothetical protein